MFLLNRKNVVLFILFLFAVAALSRPDSNLDNLEKLLAQDRIGEARELLDRLKEDYPENPVVMYLRGLFEQDADRAIFYYEKLYQRHKSSFIDDVLLKMGQYQYSLGHYPRSLEYYSLLTHRFPSSKLADDAQYLICQNLMAQNRQDSARVCLKAFIQKFPRSPFVDLAVIDLETPELWDKAEQSASLSKYRYSIQVGAFQNLYNAKNLAEKLETEGFDVEIYEKYVQRKKYYIVWVEKFETRALAKNFAERFNSFWQHYRIVEITN